LRGSTPSLIALVTALVADKRGSLFGKLEGPEERDAGRRDDSQDKLKGSADAGEVGELVAAGSVHHQVRLVADRTEQGCTCRDIQSRVVGGC